jgi:hypothetical protein
MRSAAFTAFVPGRSPTSTSGSRRTDGGTRLALIDELPAGAAARNAAGWETCLERLARLEPAPEAWRSRFDTYAAAFEPTLVPQEGPPVGYKGG